MRVRGLAIVFVLIMLILPAVVGASEWDGTLKILSISNDGVKIRFAGLEMGSDKSRSRQLPCPWERDPYFGLRDLFTCRMLTSAEITEKFETTRIFFQGERIKLIRVIVVESNYNNLKVEVVTNRTYTLSHVAGNVHVVRTRKTK